MSVDISVERSVFSFTGKAVQGGEKSVAIRTYVRTYWYRLVDGREGFLPRWLFRLDFVTLKDDGVTFLRIVEHHPISDTTSHSRRHEL